MIKLPWFILFIGKLQDKIDRWKYDRHAKKTLKKLNKRNGKK